MSGLYAWFEQDSRARWRAWVFLRMAIEAEGVGL